MCGDPDVVVRAVCSLGWREALELKRAIVRFCILTQQALCLWNARCTPRNISITTVSAYERYTECLLCLEFLRNSDDTIGDSTNAMFILLHISYTVCFTNSRKKAQVSTCIITIVCHCLSLFVCRCSQSSQFLCSTLSNDVGKKRPRHNG